MKRIFLIATLLGGIAILMAGYARYTQSPSPSPKRAQNNRILLSADIDFAEDEAELVQKSTLVVRGIPTGTSQVHSTSSDGRFAHYKQGIYVTQTLKGNATPGTVVNIGRSTFSSPNGGKVVDEEGVALGLLPAGDYVLFLQPSGVSNAYGVVGVSQGILTFGAGGYISSVNSTGFPSFVGMDINGVKSVVER